MAEPDPKIDAAAALRELGLVPLDPSPIDSETVRIGWRRHRATVSHPSMGTLVTISALNASANRAEEAVGRAFEEVERLVAILSRYDPGSPLSYLNREGSIDGLPAELDHVVERALHYNHFSGGTFDITVKPLLDLLERGTGEGGEVQPSEEALRQAVGRTGIEALESGERTLRFTREGMGLTLDGIAKGYIVDMAAEILKRHRIRDFLINAGGDIRTGGRRDDGEPWRIAVQDPGKGGTWPDTLSLTDGAVATSGSYEIYFDPERQYHHLVDSTSGRSPGERSSVSVVAPTALAADALATSLFIMGTAEGNRLIESLPRCGALKIDREGAVSVTKGWPGRESRNTGEQARYR